MKFLIEEILTERCLRVSLRSVVWALCMTGAAHASPIKCSRTLHNISRIDSASVVVTQATSQPDEKAPATTPLANLNAKPAIVTLKDGILKVEANNSELSQILKEMDRFEAFVYLGSMDQANLETSLRIS
jgi:hypothetical protein